MDQSVRRDRVDVLGVELDPLTEREVVSIVEQSIDRDERVRIGVVNAAKVIAMRSSELLRDDVQLSDLVLADGMSVVWASRLLGSALPERVAGIDLMFDFLALADRRGWRVYCLGATEEVSATIEANIARDYPGAVLAGRRNGYFTDGEAPEVARAIAEARPHFLFVAMTTPKKENFMGRFWDDMGVPIVHGVGGSFDVYAGLVERAPESWQRLGLEWLYRVKQEPGRLWKRYAKTNLQFLWLVLKALLARPFRR